MTQVPELYSLASRQNIAVLRYPMKENGSMSLMEPDGTCYIGMDDRVLDGGIQERMHLGHELGHCMTGSFTTSMPQWTAASAMKTMRINGPSVP